jgi:hypothetical protein
MLVTGHQIDKFQMDFLLFHISLLCYLCAGSDVDVCHLCFTILDPELLLVALCLLTSASSSTDTRPDGIKPYKIATKR